jgi:hypothetical protein
MAGGAVRLWSAAWPGGAVIGVANGVLREVTYGRRVSEAAAHRLSGLTGIGAFAAYFAALHRRWPIPTGGEAWAIGGIWLGLTILFEFGFGRAVAKQSWRELLADYDVVHGRTWPFVLAWIAAGPAATRRLDGPCASLSAVRRHRAGR